MLKCAAKHVGNKQAGLAITFGMHAGFAAGFLRLRVSAEHGVGSNRLVLAGIIASACAPLWAGVGCARELP